MSDPVSHRDPAAATHANAIVAEWLAKAAADLSTAEREAAVSESANYDAVCFHAQQSVEKLVKAALITRQSNPPKTHDLAHLHRLLLVALPGWEWDTHELDILTSAAVEVRYPGFSASRIQADRMLDIAVRVWARLRPLV